MKHVEYRISNQIQAFLSLIRLGNMSVERKIQYHEPFHVMRSRNEPIKMKSCLYLHALQSCPLRHLHRSLGNCNWFRTQDSGCGRGLRWHSHGVSVADVFAGRLDDGLARLVERPVYAVVCSWVGLLDQSLELKDEGHDNTDEARNSWQLVTAM